MRFRLVSLITGLVAVFMLSQPALAGVYRWVDENGQVHFGEKPPAGNTSANSVEIHKHTPDLEAIQLQRDFVRFGEARRRERERDEQKARARQAVKQHNRQVCDRYRQELRAVKSARAIYDHIDEKGEMRFLSDQERARYERQLVAFINKNCR